MAQQQHFWVCRLLFWLLPVLRLFAEEDYDHDLFGHIGSHLGLYHWRILWIVIRFFKKEKINQPTAQSKASQKAFVCPPA